jgi:hypothetical protein
MASVVISGDTSGTATIQAQAVAGNTTLTLPTTSGTLITTASGQTLTSPTITSPTITGAVMSSMASSVITSSTSQTSTSGTSIPFTDIPSWVKRITVAMNGVSCSASFGVRLGTSGGLVSTGYVGGAGVAQNGNTTSVGAKPTGFFTEGSSTITGIWTIVNFSGNTWTASWAWSNGGSQFGGGGGSIALSGTLTQLAVTGGTFSAGSVNILYE